MLREGAKEGRVAALIRPIQISRFIWRSPPTDVSTPLTFNIGTDWRYVLCADTKGQGQMKLIISVEGRGLLGP